MLVFCFADVVKFLFLVLLVYGDVVVIVWCSCFFDVLLFSLGEECLRFPTLHHFFYRSFPAVIGCYYGVL
jgi:hypothetical protein